MDKDILLSIYNDYYATCRDMKRNRIPMLDEKDRAEANRMLKESLLKFKKDFNWQNLKGAPLKTKVKFLLFLAGIRTTLIGGYGISIIHVKSGNGST